MSMYPNPNEYDDYVSPPKPLRKMRRRKKKNPLVPIVLSVVGLVSLGTITVVAVFSPKIPETDYASLNQESIEAKQREANYREFRAKWLTLTTQWDKSAIRLNYGIDNDGDELEPGHLQKMTIILAREMLAAHEQLRTQEGSDCYNMSSAICALNTDKSIQQTLTRAATAPNGEVALLVIKNPDGSQTTRTLRNSELAILQMARAIAQDSATALTHFPMYDKQQVIQEFQEDYDYVRGLHRQKLDEVQTAQMNLWREKNGVYDDQKFNY